jgi:FixJ family two-component response regulator
MRIEAACGPAGIPPFKAQPFGSLYRQRHSTDMKESPPIVYVVDDEPSVCLALKRLLRSVGLEARTFGSALEFLHSKRPDGPGCLILDVRLPGLSGPDLQAELAARKITLPIIFVTGHGDIPMSVRAMKAGAVEFLTKPYREQELLEAIQRAIDRDGIVRQRSAELRSLQERYALLTPREREVFPRVTSGLLNKQTAAELGASEKTIKVHRGQVMQKMEAKSLADLIHMAEKLGLPSD